MTTGSGTICSGCRHLQGGEDVTTCTSFPDGIPDAIIFGGFDHRRPFGGERKRAGEPILFELRDSDRARTWLKRYEESHK